MKTVPFNKPYLTGKETHYIYQAVQSGKISGNGQFTQRCHTWFKDRFGFKKCLLTTSCTDALEMAAILCDIKPGDEVIAPSYTFVSTVNAFILRGAKIVFVDSCEDHPNMDVGAIEPLINSRTKVIVPVHYAGVACDMDAIMALANKYNLLVVEDAAQAIDSYYNGHPLGSIGHMAAFSFHETKNIQAGEGGMLVVNDDRFAQRAEIIWEKGTNRSAFFRGEVDKYGWVDIGSSFLPSEVIAAFLFAQLENLDDIQAKRKEIWESYMLGFAEHSKKGHFKVPYLPSGTTNNGHMFYLEFPNLEARTKAIEALKNSGINAVFHYISLHSSPYYKAKHDGRPLPMSDHYTDTLLRLPLFYELSSSEQQKVIETINGLYA